MKTKKKTQKRRLPLKKLLGIVVAMLTLCTMLAVPAFADEAATASETTTATTTTQTAPGFGDLIADIFEAFPAVTTGLAEGLKDSFTALIYVDPAATTLQFSPLVQFMFVMTALSLAAGLLFLIFRVIRPKSKG